LAIKEEMYSF